MMAALGPFLSSFLVLFLELTFSRWMPSYIRLLSYFSNFILLASVLGIGLGCLLAPVRLRLFTLFPLVQLAVVLAVHFLRLEVAAPTATSIYFSSGTTEPVALLPFIFLIVAALFTTLAHRMGRQMSAHEPLRGYTINVAGRLAGVAAFGLVSWLELPPTAWFAIATAVAAPLLLTPEPGARRYHPAVVAAGLASL